MRDGVTQTGKAKQFEKEDLPRKWLSFSLIHHHNIGWPFDFYCITKIWGRYPSWDGFPTWIVDQSFSWSTDEGFDGSMIRLLEDKQGGIAVGQQGLALVGDAYREADGAPPQVFNLRPGDEPLPQLGRFEIADIEGGRRHPPT